MSTQAQAARLDGRILNHLLVEITDLLEESQSYLVIEHRSASVSAALAQATYVLSSTCSWVLVQRDGVRGFQPQLAPLGLISLGELDGGLSDELNRFFQRVERLHERAVRLDHLTGADAGGEAQLKLILSERAEPTTRHQPVEEAGERAPAQILPLFGAGAVRSKAAREPSAIRQSQDRVLWAMGAW